MNRFHIYVFDFCFQSHSQHFEFSTNETAKGPTSPPTRTTLAPLPRPRHVDYSTLDSRIRSFRGVNCPAGQDPTVLAVAGFFHVG